MPPYDTETLLLKLSEESEATKTLVRKLTGTDVDENIFEVHKAGETSFENLGWVVVYL